MGKIIGCFSVPFYTGYYTLSPPLSVNKTSITKHLLQIRHCFRCWGHKTNTVKAKTPCV